MATEPGSIVLNSFEGSGTTCVAAAELLRRRWLGVELYCADAISRLRDAAGDAQYLEKIALEKNVFFKGVHHRLKAQPQVCVRRRP